MAIVKNLLGESVALLSEKRSFDELDRETDFEMPLDVT